MDKKIRYTIIPCPECGTTGLFTCTNCKHEVKFSLKLNIPDKELEYTSEKIKKEGPEKDYINPDEFDVIEDLINELSINTPDEVKEETNKQKIKNNDVPKEQLKVKEDRKSGEEAAAQSQAFIEDIKASLLEDLKSSITEAVGTMKKDLLDKLKTEKKPEKPEVKNDETKNGKPKKATADSGKGKKIEKSAKELPDKVSNKDKKGKAKTLKKPDGITEELRKEEPEIGSTQPEKGNSWNKRIDVI